MIEKIVEQIRKGIDENSEARDAVRDAMTVSDELQVESVTLRETFRQVRDALTDKGRSAKLLALLGNATLSATSAGEIIGQATDGSVLPSAESLNAAIEYRRDLLSNAFRGAEAINQALVEARESVQQAMLSIFALRLLVENYDAGPVLDMTNTIHTLSERFIADLTGPSLSE